EMYPRQIAADRNQNKDGQHHPFCPWVRLEIRTLLLGLQPLFPLLLLWLGTGNYLTLCHATVLSDTASLLARPCRQPLPVTLWPDCAHTARTNTLHSLL